MSNDERDRIIVEGWGRGVPVRSLASSTGWSAGWVSTRARRLGLPARLTAFSVDETAAAIAAYEGGDSLVAVARRLGRSVEALRAGLVRAGVTIVGAAERSRRWPVDHHAFSAPLSAEAWYWLGFLAADGSVAATRLFFGLAPSSEPALRRFGQFIGCPDKPLRTAARGRQLVLEVHSATVVGDLALHGIRPRKTWDLHVSVAAAQEPAFWLGYLDGDGCVVISPAGVPRIHLVGTRALMEQHASFLSVDICDRRPSVHRHSAEGSCGRSPSAATPPAGSRSACFARTMSASRRSVRSSRWRRGMRAGSRGQEPRPGRNAARGAGHGSRASLRRCEAITCSATRRTSASGTSVTAVADARLRKLQWRPRGL